MSQVAFVVAWLFCLLERGVNMRKAIVVGISLLFFIGLVAQASARHIHCWDLNRDNVCDFDEDINEDGKCNGRDCEKEEQCYAVPQTGQTTIYATGDDGDLQKGVAWPDPRFTDNGDDTVTDNLTHLIWTQNVNIYGQINWSEALTSCDSCNVGGYDDWYLPNVRELNSLIDYGGAQYQKLPAGHPFTGSMGSSYFYWSSTSHGGSPYSVSFENGRIVDVSVNYLQNVWCVRSND
jgi:hypothetical protein